MNGRRRGRDAGDERDVGPEVLRSKDAVPYMAYFVGVGLLDDPSLIVHVIVEIRAHGRWSRTLPSLKRRDKRAFLRPGQSYCSLCEEAY